MASNSVSQPELRLPIESILALLRKYNARDPARIALVDLEDERAITWGELYTEANRIAHWLERRGIKKGDRIAVLAEENIEKLLIWIGVWRYGAVVCPLNVEMNEVHLNEILVNIGPKITLWHEALDGPKLTAGVSGEIMRFARWRGQDAAGEFFTDLARRPSAPEIAQWNEPDDISCIFCTSGTTAKPKSVVYNHRAYWLNGLDTLDMLELGPDDRTLEYRSFGWNSAQVLSLMPWLQTGLTLHIAKRFSHSRFFVWVKKYGITFAAGVPTVVNMLLNKPLGVTAKDIPTLRLMTCSTAALSPEQWSKFEEMYGLTLLQLYGMSEAGWICGNRHDRRRMGTVGPPARHQEFLIVDGEGKPCPPGIEGEVEIGGPQSCIATISPEGSWEDMRGKRTRTGDLAMMDSDGFVRVTGRTKDLIIRGGVNIAPMEIDHVLLANQHVLEAATVGVPDKIYGEEVVAYVVAKSGVALTAEDIRAHCASKLAEFKTPKQVYFVDTIPRSDRGKVKRDVLREKWVKEHGGA